MISIRRETPADHDAIRQVTIDAFSSSVFGHDGEADLVDTIRATASPQFSLVATSEETVVGYVVFSPATLNTGNGELTGMGLGPLSVLPEFQRQGIGSQLVTNGLTHAWATGAAFVIVLGHPDYYPRFGFVPALDHSVTHGFAGIPQNCFLIQFSPRHTPASFHDGKAYYHDAFGPQFESE